MVEFALVTPVLLFLLFATLDGSLLLFTVGSARFAAGEGAQTVAELGNDPNADKLAIKVIHDGPLNQTGLATISKIEIYRETQAGNGALSQDNANTNAYDINGTAIGSTPWPSTGRNIKAGTSDFVGLRISYKYGWNVGVLLPGGPLSLTQNYDLRLEPQSY
jgi:Flp pilus assembly protein TadG